MGLTKLLAVTGHTISSRARGALIWGAALGALGALFVAIYPSISGSSAGMEQMVSSMPDAMKELIGFGAGTFGSVEGFVGGEMLSFLVPLALSFFPILLASSALAGAEEDGTVDVLMGNPLSRPQFVLGRFLAAAVLLLGIVTLMGAATWLTGVIADVDLGLGSMAAASLTLWALCISFGGLAPPAVGGPAPALSGARDTGGATHPDVLRGWTRRLGGFLRYYPAALSVLLLRLGHRERYGLE